LTALSAKSGKPFWTTSFSGTSSLTAASEVPSFDTLLHDAKGPSRDILITLHSFASGPGFETAADLVSGKTGAKHAYATTTSSLIDYAVFFRVPDLTGDGLDDVVMTLDSTSPIVEALHGHSGTKIWTTHKVAVSGFGGVTAVGHLTPGKAPDLAVSRTISMMPPLNQITVVRGSNGHRVWSRKASVTYALSHAGPKGQPAVLLERLVYGMDGTHSGNAVTFAAVSSTNKVLYTRRASERVVTANPQTSGSFAEGVEPIGDVQADGAPDFNVQMEVVSSSSTVTHKATVDDLMSGRTGALHKIDFDTGSKGSLHKGAATDLLAVSLHNGAPEITAWNGSTRKRYYSKVIPGLHSLFWAWTGGLRVTGHSCSDVSLATTRANGQDTLGVLTARGKRLWSINFSATQATGGELVRYPKPKHYCV
jgi:hypothetical protein